MKRLFTLCLTIMSALVTFALTIQEGKVYSIHNAKSTGAYMQDNLRADNVADAFGLNDNSYWTFIPTGKANCYYIKNYTTKRYMQGHGNQTQVDIKMGSEPAEYYVASYANEGGAFGFASTSASVYDGGAGCVGLNLRGEPYEAVSCVQTYAAVAGTNHRSFWVLEEVDPNTIMPEEDFTGVPESDLYHNPLIKVSLPDPTVMKMPDGYYYLYATENVRNMPIYRSSNLVDWDFLGTCFTEETRPTFVKTDRASCLWAPDINYIDGKYVMYYSMSDWGGEWTCGVGVATADKPEGPFTDQGPLFISSQMNTQNSIDPFYIEEDGHKYLFWGSFRGIWYTELTADGLQLKDGMKSTKVADTLTEGTYIIKRPDGYFYMIGSAGTCCDGLNSTYRLVVSRSKSLFGPYVNKDGGSVMENKWSPLLGKSAEVYGPGHCSEIIEDNEGQTWVFYHGWDAATGGGRYLYLDQVLWDEDGWPYIKRQKPSTTSRRPVITDDPTDVNTIETAGMQIRRVKDSFTVSLGDDKPFTWSLATLHGEVVANGKARGSVEVDTYAVRRGLYILTATAGKKKYSEKILKY